VGDAIRVIVANSDEGAGPELRAFLLSIDGVKIVAEIDEPGMLEHALKQFPAEMLLLHLDPSPEAMMAVAGPLLGQHKQTLAAVGMTEDRNADLVVQAMRAGMREFLWKPFNPDQLRDIIVRIGAEAREKRVSSGVSTGRLVTVVGSVGGVGATTLAVNLAVEMASLGSSAAESDRDTAERSVAVVDLDFRFGQVATLLDAQPNYTIAELCESAEQIDSSMIERAMLKHATGVHVLARPSNFAQAEHITAAHCAGVLSVLQEQYDFVVVDGPNRFDNAARAVFDLADSNLLVLQLLVPSVRNADRIMQELRTTGYNMDRMQLVCNRCGREAGYLEPSDVETILSRKIDWYLPDDWKTSSMAVNMGQPLASHAPKSKLRQVYRQIAAKLVHGEQESVDIEGGDSKKGGLRSFFSGGQKA
jgi:pilus assembly protein CpaE